MPESEPNPAVAKDLTKQGILAGEQAVKNAKESPSIPEWVTDATKDMPSWMTEDKVAKENTKPSWIPDPPKPDAFSKGLQPENDTQEGGNT